VFLKACINGARVAMTPAQIASEAAACLAAGADAIHAHVYGANGRESLNADDVANVVRAAKVGISTGAWIIPNAEERVRVVGEWLEMPEFASVNFIEEGAIDVARMLFTAGVEIEAGLSAPDAARRFVDSGIPCVRILLEPQEQSLDDALRNVDAMEQILDGIHAPRVLHGYDATAWPLLDEAHRRGCGARIGFEDTLLMRDGTRAESNAALVRAARER